MRFRIVVVGRPRSQTLADAIRDYEERAGHYWPLDVREVKAADAAREWPRLEEAAAGATLVLCDEGGRTFDSPGFAAWLDKLRAEAKDVAFVIGGAFGVPDTARAKADERLSLAPWTLPHELARLVLAEQLYRAGTIGRGEPYHK
ncbi:MAG TPA: 23S rRNA (pseudouridine(1915)-N(3))-methyltransferase RlmH [Acidimicrobiales bacterium]|nr:23S rRNA (pseudouridine(1915)-N(3))-methyltransferase RlmH [Acidimicrobiales bacterium]